MALVERLCQVYEGDESHLNIALNPFCEVLFRVLDGRHSIQDVKNFYAMTPEDEAEFDVLVANVTSDPKVVERVLAIHQVRAILTFWECRNDLNAPNYNTVADIRSELNNI